jgi:peroxiredoxin
MKTALLLLALVLSPSLAAAGVGKGQKAPDFNLPTLKGPKLALSSLRGKVVILDFWAQWCEPCKKELPELEKLQQRFAGKVAVVSVNIDKQRANAEALAGQLKLSFPVALDPQGAVAATYDLPKMPTSFVLDQKGVVRYVHEGFDGAGDVKRFEKEIGELTK